MLCNIVTGQIAEENVNVNKSVMNGKALMTKFTEKLPQGFRSTQETQRGRRNPLEKNNTVSSQFSQEYVI